MRHYLHNLCLSCLAALSRVHIFTQYTPAAARVPGFPPCLPACLPACLLVSRVHDLEVLEDSVREVVVKAAERQRSQLTHLRYEVDHQHAAAVAAASAAVAFERRCVRP